MEYLYEKLTAYGNSDYYAFHMPGHKRNMELMRARLPYNIDITEIDGFDDLHHAEGLLKELQENAARVFHAEETHYLVNGSTVGLLSAVMGCTERGGRILMARNCHKSVYNAIYMNELRPVYIYPEFSEETDLNGEIHVDQIKKLLEEYEDIQVVVIVSPTYEGVVSDIEAIAEIVHEYKIPLIVDEAHGAHFGFHSYFPQNANTRGADVVIHTDGMLRLLKEMRRTAQTSRIPAVLRDKQIVYRIPGKIGDDLIGARHKFENIGNRLQINRHINVGIPCFNVIISSKAGAHTVTIGTDVSADGNRMNLCQKIIKIRHSSVSSSASSARSGISFVTSSIILDMRTPYSMD